jgi:PAS domain S-box-containing protein
MTAEPASLDELERDAITELANIGVSRAAASLRKMVGHQVLLSVPSVDILTRRAAAALISERESDELVAVQQAFAGSFSGRAMLIFPQSNSLHLLRAIIGDDEMCPDEAAEMETEALAETGNVILNGCLGTIANMLRQSLTMSLPEVVRGSSTLLFQPSRTTEDEGLVLFLYINFSVRERDIRGYIAMLMDLPALDAMRGLVAEFISRYVPSENVTAEIAASSLEEVRELAGPLFSFMERAGVAMAVTDPRLANNPFIFVNEAFTGLTGYKADEISGRGWSTLQGPESEASAAGLLETAIREGREIEIEILNHRKDGIVFRNRTFVSPIPNRSGQSFYMVSKHENVLGANRDELHFENRRKRREEVADRLRRSLSLAGGSAAWEWHVQQGRVVGDARFADLYGLKPEDASEGISGETFFSIVHPDDRTRVRLAIDGMLRGAEIFSKEYRIVAPNGSMRWVHARGYRRLDEPDHPVFLGVLVDVTDQKRIEEELRIAQTAGGIGTFEHIDGFATATVSSQFCRLLGLHEARSLPVRTINALVDPGDPPLIDLTSRRQSSPPHAELRVKRADTGEVRWLARRGEHLHDAETAGVRFSGVIYDITHSKNSEQLLRVLNEDLESRVRERTRERDGIWQLSHDLFGIADKAGRWLNVNPAWTRILGWAPGDIVGKTSAWSEHPSEKGEFKRALIATGRSEANAVVRRFRHRDGTYRSISWTIVANGNRIYATGRDVSAQIAQAAALEQSQARIRSVFETSYQYQALLTPAGVLLEANQTSLEGIRVTLRDVVGKPYWETPWFSGTPDVATRVKEAIPLIAAGQTLRQEIVLQLPGGRRTFDLSLRPLMSEEGAVIGIVSEAIDLTERREAEEQLRQAQKMQALGELTGGIAHDFNNMLAVMIAGLTLAERKLAKGEDARTYMQGALEGAHRAASLTNRLLVFSRQLPLTLVPLDANQLVVSMSEMLKRALGETISLKTVLADGLGKTNTDSGQLESALLNLAINARDAMPDGGELVIETSNVELGARDVRKHRDLEPGQFVRILVSDTGTGMPTDVMDRAFDPFFTTKDVGKGTGLGLSQVYGFVKQSKGHLDVQSQPGRGTAVTIYLPRFHGAAEINGTGQSRHVTPIGSSSEIILVVEDEARMRDMSVAALRELGFTVLQAESGAGALEILKNRPDVTLLFTDVVMPDMNGKRLAEEAVQVRPYLKVLFTSGYTPTTNGIQAWGNGEHFIGKPFTLDQLCEKVRHALSSAQNSRSPKG